ncbi:hypothetical protein [Chloroflexus sp.]|uniref:hypothetical protein n=1 Tax=Chloroflexus sp. TaxID=1904827 RepID=UPI002ADDF047|nr:hypothetical protein [Chloroflexus sp.]
MRMLRRDITDRTLLPRAVIVDGRMLPSKPERGGRAGDDGHKRRKDTKVPGCGYAGAGAGSGGRAGQRPRPRTGGGAGPPHAGGDR